MFRRIKIEKAEDLLAWSIIIEAGVGIGASVIAVFMPPPDIARTLIMLDALIRLDGVLFGFSGVMVGLFINRLKSMNKRALYDCVMFFLLAFWSYFLSLVFAFINVYTGIQNSAFMAVPLTLFGILCSSIYTLMVSIGEQMPQTRTEMHLEER